MSTISNTDFRFSGQIAKYSGKVRDVYELTDQIILVATDRVSAFDHILPRPIPYKGQVLTKIASYFLEKTRDIVPNWMENCPDPNVMIGVKCEPIKIEMVIRGYLAGHAWRSYQSGERVLCGVEMPDGMRQNQAFPAPIITPATKADSGHDEDISKEEILDRGIVSAEVYHKLEEYTQKLFARGTKMAAERGLILVDTKYEFGLYNGQIMLIDEVHTPDSSRYWYENTYQTNLQADLPQEQLSKEFVREWLMEQGFQGLEGQQMPAMSDEFVLTVSNRYRNLCEKITGLKATYAEGEDPISRIESNVSRHIRQANPV